MKLKNWFELIGIKGDSKRFGTKLEEFKIDGHGVLNYANWMHPKEKKKTITNEDVNCYRKFLNKGDFCIDIGAHTGDSTLPMAVAVEKEGLVLAFEPNHFVYPVLQQNCFSNREKLNIIPVFGAAHSKDEELKFQYSDQYYCNGGDLSDVSVFKRGHNYELSVLGIDIKKFLELYFKKEMKNLKFIKTDTEGNDFYIINSLEAILKKYRPVLKSEVFKQTSHEYRLNFLKFLKGLEYDIYFVCKEPCYISYVIDERNISEIAHYDFLAIPQEKSQDLLTKLKL
ncbi:MAG: FkbM family methyltransferase [Candidatus Muirbacterium halophilum]|nr:FkbM family methyltransferase [Candidatus Muirbacterium halophilum]MCK9474639.1 FkbM family methyltransferase [Candidatus Muirbacterium halophilum]